MKAREQELRSYLLDKFSRELDPREARIRTEAGVGCMVDHALPLLLRREPGEIGLRVSNLEGQRSGRTIIQVLLEDQPFLADTLLLNIRRSGLRDMLMLHPLLTIERDEDGSVFGTGRSAANGQRESYLYAEIPLVPDAGARSEIEASLRRVFGQVQDVVSDHARMVKALRGHIADVEYSADGIDGGPERAAELMSFLSWLTQDNYVFLGYRRYRASKVEGLWEVSVEPGSGLGLLRDPVQSRFVQPLSGEALPAIIRSRLEDERPVFFDKSRSASTIHREGRLDCVSIKLRDGLGQVSGFGSFVGLLTHTAIRTRSSEVPVVRTRRRAVLERLDAEPGSHSYKAAIEAFDSLPIEFLFLAELRQVSEAIQRVLRSAEGHEVQVVVVPDPLNWSFFLSVVLPRALYREGLRASLTGILAEKYGVNYVDHRVSWVDDNIALIHFFCRCTEDVDPECLPALETDVRICTMRWEERVDELLLERFPEEDAIRLASEYLSAFPQEYRVVSSGEETLLDLENLELLRWDSSSVELAFHPGEADTLRLAVYQRDRPYLTDLLPVLDHFGLRVIDATLTEVACSSGESLWIVAFRIERLTEERDLEQQRQVLVLEGLRASFRRVVESNDLNRLVVRAGLGWREVDLTRAYLAYAQQLGIAPQPVFARKTLLRHAQASRALIALFRARFDPDLTGDRADEERRAAEALAHERQAISTSEEDRVFALLENLVGATLRTSFFIDEDADDHAIVLKIRPSCVEQMPAPCPFAEIFVHSAEMSGAHLRGGPVARGGIRWSDRIQDFRTEVLGLLKTQMVKNGLIAPVGSKGGFVLKHSFADSALARSEADRQYGRFIRSLLSVTDNDVGGSIVPPDRVIRHDEDDPYLVVAADKGTAHLSDAANEIAEELGFWLGDAFASGGSRGYDHKVEGITARGGWVCVTRHLCELGIDPERETFTMVGIGDMSGDVFGNGLLLARKAKLLAAFNHRHVFLDPDPDPETAWLERKRLFETPRSRWTDYDSKQISSGGGVFERAAKSIPLSAQARSILGVESDAMTGEELVRAVLRMPVDLLWNGGIGTYVKSDRESDADVGDRDNDSVRVDARELRSRIVGEGGNLGFTQLARVEFALGGGRINTDSVDNSGGVDLSDHEVNFKVLVAARCRDGRMARDERDRLLTECVAEACAAVLAHNSAQARCISMDLARGHRDPERIALASEFLEAHAGLDRDLEFLPGRDELRSRAQTSGELSAYTRPELAVLLGYTKMLVKREIAASELPAHASLGPLIAEYFPSSLSKGLAGEISSHPLYREIAASCVTNAVVDQAGITLVPELVRAFGASIEDAVSAYYTADRMLNTGGLFRAIDSLDAPEDVRLEAALDVERSVRAAARSLLALERRVLLAPEELARSRELLDRLRERLSADPPLPNAERIRRGAAWFVERGVNPELATQIGLLSAVVQSLGLIELVSDDDASLDRAARVHARVGELTCISWLLDLLRDPQRWSGWDRAAAESLCVEMLDVQRRLTTHLLGLGSCGDDGEPLRVSAGAALRRIEETARQIQAEERPGFAALAVLGQQIERIG